MLARLPGFSKRIIIFAFVLLLGTAAMFCIYVVHRAGEAVADGARSAAAANQVAVSVSTLRGGDSRLEPVLDAADFESAVGFNGDLYVCSSSALFRYSEGGLKQTWRAGNELPAARFLSIAVRSGIGNPELWMATAGAGIVIYDGVTFRQFVPVEPELRKISALLALANGQVLIGTATRGLYTSDGKSLRVFHPQFSNASVTALAGDENQLWIGTRADGAWLWRGGEAQHILAELPDKQVLSLAVDGDDAWVGTPVGVAEFRSGGLTRRLADGIFAQALAQHEGKLWIGTVDQGVFALPLAVAKARPQTIAANGEAGSISSFAAIGDTLAGVEPRAIEDVSGKRPLVTGPANALASGHVTAVHEDSRGRLWIGYFDRGIDVVPPGGSGTPLHFEDDTLFCINRIKEDARDGSVLVATGNGLAVFDAAGKLRQVLSRENGLIASNVTDVLFQGSGLAVATPSGLSFVEGGSVSSIYAFQGLVNNHVFTLADLNGNLYAGTLGGVSVVRRGLVQASFNTANSALRQNWITASAVFEKHLYVGTYGSGVVRFDGDGGIESFRSFSGHRFEINLNALLATSRALYAGTAGYGLAILRAGETHWQFVTEGLPSLNVTALDERSGRLYVGTDNGLVRISENNRLP